MRTSINFDDDVHFFASIYAKAKGIGLSEAVNELIRKAESAPPPSAPEIRRSPNGLPLFPPTGRTITSKMVKELEEGEFDPEKFA
ncbi:MAG TPA: hypothetical protein VMU71_09160 [Terracidiphilus sp.]|nr:hypothetical protein [Terracidiphilus sp.]